MERATGPQASTKSFRQSWSAESESLPQGRAHRVLIQYQVIRPQKIKREKSLHLRGWWLCGGSGWVAAGFVTPESYEDICRSHILNLDTTEILGNSLVISGGLLICGSVMLCPPHLEGSVRELWNPQLPLCFQPPAWAIDHQVSLASTSLQCLTEPSTHIPFQARCSSLRQVLPA